MFLHLNAEFVVIRETQAVWCDFDNRDIRRAALLDLIRKLYSYEAAAYNHHVLCILDPFLDNVTKSQALSYIIPLGATFLFLSGGVVIFLVGLDLGAWLIERDKMRQARFDSQFGFTVYDYDAGRWILEAPSDKYRSLPAPRPQSVKVSPGQVYATSTPNTTVEPLVREFLEAAARHAENGKDDNKIPSWRQLPGWTSERWQRAVDVLKVSRVVDPRDMVGTFVREGTIGDVLYQLDTHQLKLTPLPHRDASRR